MLAQVGDLRQPLHEVVDAPFVGVEDLVERGHEKLLHAAELHVVGQVLEDFRQLGVECEKKIASHSAELHTRVKFRRVLADSLVSTSMKACGVTMAGFTKRRR